MHGFTSGSTRKLSHVRIDMIFIAMNAREQAGTEHAVHTNQWASASARGPMQRAPAPWLACYPIFREALLGSETSLGALPDFARRAALERLGDASRSCVHRSVLDGVRASYLELRSTRVAEEVRRYLSDSDGDTQTSRESSDALETLAAGMPRMLVPPVARPPCLLSSGAGIFLGGWGRFVAYWCRRDPTIPLLAVDWPILYEHVAPDRLCKLTDDHTVVRNPY
jgi:hypothetical protein